MPQAIDWTDYAGAAVDLDGVVTRTADLHSRAWKQMFDELLDLRRRRNQPTFEPFSEERDYPELVDGIPRLDGVRAFLSSRNIQLNAGEQDDTLEDQTVTGLGNRKNHIYHRLLAEESASVFTDAVECLRRLRDMGLALCVVSSSRNCARVLRSAGLADLFVARVDGNTLAQKKLSGKPAPDMFTEAARRLGVRADRSIAMEDAAPGVESASRAGYAMVIGVDRAGVAEELRSSGADIVINSFETIMPDEPTQNRRTNSLPSALDALDDIYSRASTTRTAICCDFDGTLTPIVDRPEDAELSATMRRTLAQLAERIPVAIITGRDRKDIQRRVGIAGLWYAGSHGFDIATPEGKQEVSRIGEKFLADIDDAEQLLNDRLSSIEGAQVERKRFSVSVHYRRVRPDDRDFVIDTAREIAEANDSLRTQDGKMLVEVRPAADWDKGRAVEHIMDRMGLDASEDLIMYIGDDVTDRDAFRAVNRLGGISILVGDALESSAADYRLDDSNTVHQFLNNIAAGLEVEA